MNLVERRVEVYSGPSGPAAEPGYAQQCEYSPADEMPLLIAGREVARLAVRDLLP